MNYECNGEKYIVGGFLKSALNAQDKSAAAIKIIRASSDEVMHIAHLVAIYIGFLFCSVVFITLCLLVMDSNILVYKKDIAVGYMIAYKIFPNLIKKAGHT